MSVALEQAYWVEINNALIQRRQHNWAQAWFHAERAHIVGQQQFILHMHSHWFMLKLASEQVDWTEIRGQLLRLIMTPIGHLTGRLPLGNPGSSRYPLLEAQPVPDDLKALLADTRAREL